VGVANTLLTPYEQYFIQTLHQGQLIPEQFAGGKNPLLQLAIDPAYTPLEETSQITPSYSTHSATLPLTVSLPTTTGMYLSNTLNFT
jgi:hypothetical protein